MVQFSCSFATNCRPKYYFARTAQGQEQLILLNSWVYSIKEHLGEVNVSQTYISSEKKLILTRIRLREDNKGRDFTMCPNIVHNLVGDSDHQVRKSVPVSS